MKVQQYFCTTALGINHLNDHADNLFFDEK